MSYRPGRAALSPIRTHYPVEQSFAPRIEILSRQQRETIVRVLVNVARQRRPLWERYELSGPSCRRADASDARQPSRAPALRRLLIDGPFEDTCHRGIREQHDRVEGTLPTQPVDERRERRALHMAVAEELTAEINQQCIGA
jgi:hypothetical protein